MALLLCLSLFLSFSLPATAEESQPLGASNLADKKEIISKRGVYSKTYILPDGSYQYVGFSEPIHYKNSAGVYVEINNEITDDSKRDGYKYANTANAWSAYFSERLNDNNAVMMVFGKHNIAFSFMEQTGTAHAQKSTDFSTDAFSGAALAYYQNLSADNRAVVYRDVAENVDVVYTVKTGILKEDIILKSKQAPSIFKFRLTTNGLTLKESGSTFALFTALDEEVLLICSISLITGCSKEHIVSNADVQHTPNSFAIYNVSVETDATTEKGNNEDNPLWTLKKSTLQGDSAPENITVTFDGKLYTGEYWYSTVVRHNPYTSHYYSFSDGWFSVKSNTAEVDCIFFASPLRTNGYKSAEECKESALTLAKQYIDTGDYKLTMEITEDFYSYLFERYVENIRTDAFLSIGIDRSGELMFFSYGSTDELDTAVDRFEKDALKDRIALYTSEAVISAIGNEQIERFGKSSEVKLDDPVLVVLEDGDVGVVYDVSVEVIAREENIETHTNKHARYVVGPCETE